MWINKGNISHLSFKNILSFKGSKLLIILEVINKKVIFFMIILQIYKGFSCHSFKKI
ncbi:hemolysin III-like protein [Capnocytophaga sp. oral taxon 338 str. F0234]|nr:hemolysin III-like protein [Capnocytophaga sp. oral taxon 338 str. F0234]